MRMDEVFREYEETLAKIDRQAHAAREEARAILHGQLATLRDTAHKELRAILIKARETEVTK